MPGRKSQDSVLHLLEPRPGNAVGKNGDLLHPRELQVKPERSGELSPPHPHNCRCLSESKREL